MPHGAPADDAHAAVLAAYLVGAPLDACLYPAAALERAAAVLRTSYGGGPELPHHAAMRRTEAAISATLRARRSLDEPTRPLAPADATALAWPWPSDDGGGDHMPIVPGPAPTTPPAGAAIALTPDRGRDF